MTALPPYDTVSTASRSEPTFTKCCFCIPLRIGCFILGYMNLVFNTFHTLALLTLTTYIGISTHGFDHFDKEPRQFSDRVPEIESVEKPFLNQIGILLMVVLCVNVAWLVINVACLVGLHKRHPGPIRVYVGFATCRLMLSLAGFVYLSTTASANTQTLFTHSVDLGLAAYFILVYYIYSAQLERERAADQETGSGVNHQAPGQLPGGFSYPSNIDKHTILSKVLYKC